MPLERLRSRATPEKATFMDVSNVVDPNEVKALNARLSDRRRERREQRLKQNRHRGGASSKAGSRRASLVQAKQLPFALGIGVLLLCWIVGFVLLARRTHILSSANQPVSRCSDDC